MRVVRVAGTPQRPILTFAEVSDRSGAEALRDRELWADRLDVDALLVADLVGAKVRDQHSVDRGAVVAVEANPASELMVLESGALVPTVFIERVEDGYVIVNAPDGLFDL
jgi:16S rRNA processing protein RimM